MIKGQSPFKDGSFIEWLTPRVDKVDAGYITPCWLWNLSTNKKGYAQWRLPRLFGDPTKTIGVHRASYANLIGPIQKGLVIDHLCRNRSCQNPEHLEAVTAGENTRRGINQFVVRDRCSAGHVYTDASMYYAGRKRKCRICQRAAMHAHRTRVRELRGQFCRSCSALLSETNMSGYCSRCVNVRFSDCEDEKLRAKFTVVTGKAA